MTTRKEFIAAGAAFAGAAGSVLAVNDAPAACGAAGTGGLPALRVGIISDIHVSNPVAARSLENILRIFDDLFSSFADAVCEFFSFFFNRVADAVSELFSFFFDCISDFCKLFSFFFDCVADAVSKFFSLFSNGILKGFSNSVNLFFGLLCYHCKLSFEGRSVSGLKGCC